MANPVGTGPYRLEGMAPRTEDRAGGESRRIATSSIRRAAIPTIARSRSSRGRKLPLVGRVEISIIEESQSAPARLRAGRPRLRRGAARPRPERARPGQQAEAAPRQGWHHARARHPARDHLFVLQHGGSGRRRLHAGQDRAAARDRHGVQRRRGDPRAPRGPGDARDAAACRRTFRATTRNSTATRSSIPAAAKARARQVRLRRPRQGRLARHAGRQAARAQDRHGNDGSRPAVHASCGSAA